MSCARALAVALLVACGSQPAPSSRPANTVTTPPPDTAPAVPDDDCTLQLEAITSKLGHAAPGVRTLEAPARVDRKLTEAIELADGTRVDFSLGGCAHYAWELIYLIPASAVGVAADQRLDYVAALLERTPIADGLAVQMAQWIRGRPRPVTDPAGPWSIPCGDAVCEVEVKTAIGARTHLRIKVRYDFPL
jgi:hypothetical protein